MAEVSGGRIEAYSTDDAPNIGTIDPPAPGRLFL